MPEEVRFADASALAIIDVPHDRAPLAQLDRASGYEPEGREFESLRARHFLPHSFEATCSANAFSQAFFSSTVALAYTATLKATPPFLTISPTWSPTVT